ncbi:hypothetical protein B0H14DRAFT_2560530 [Mycena olivaceomarginata]|nr:hypothetical protein B0H14DRAFT_2560530 [Mycena olivaceomarginata]
MSKNGLGSHLRALELRSRPHRNAFPSARIADSNNTEPPTAHQQRALAAVRFFTLIKKIETFAPLLPDSVKEASTDDNELHCTSGIDDSPWGALNCQLDKLFGVDTREDGRLKHIHRGEHGMSFVASHLAGLDWIKLQRVVDEMEYLWFFDWLCAGLSCSYPVDVPVFVFRFQEDLLAVLLYSNSAHKYPVYPTYRVISPGSPLPSQELADFRWLTNSSERVPTTPSIPLPPTAMLHLQVISDENEEGLEPESDY